MSQDGSFRPMKYPYTLTGKIAQFPYKYYFQHSWLFKYMIFGALATLPVFYQIQKLCKFYITLLVLTILSDLIIYYLFSAYAPENVAKWEKIHRETFHGTPGHH